MSNERQPPKSAPVAGIEPASPGDRVNKVRQLQQMMEAGGVQQARPAAPAQATSAPVPAAPVARAMSVEQLQQLGLSPKADAAFHARVASRQVDAQSLFGGPGSEIEIRGNPWKVIPFGDALPGLFSSSRALDQHTPVVPEKALQVAQGLLFEVGLAGKQGGPVVEKRAVLTDAGGKLLGAFCERPADLQRLLSQTPGLFQSLAGFALPTRGVAVRPGAQSRFQVELKRGGKTEVLHLNNFGQRVPPSKNPAEHDVQLELLRDRFEAAV